MNFSTIALFLLRSSTCSGIFPAPLQHRKQGECVNGRMEDLRGEAAHPPSLKVEELVLTEEECKQLVDTTSEEEFDQGATVSGIRFYTKIDIAEDLYKKLRDPSLARNGKLEVYISRVLETSMPHRDGYYNNSHLGVSEGALVDEEVTMLFLNDNAGASFIYGEEKVPVKCGTKVTFNGGHTHNTEVLAGGAVMFLGPHTVSSGLNSENYDGQCEELEVSKGGVCSCAACDRNLENNYDGDYVNSCCAKEEYISSCVSTDDYLTDPDQCPDVKSSKCCKSSKMPKSIKNP